MAVVTASGIDAIVSAMRSSVSADVASAACQALMCLGAANRAVIDMIVSAGGTDAVASAMRRFSESEAVQIWGCRALVGLWRMNSRMSLAVTPRAGPAMLVDTSAAGTVTEVVVSAMKSHQGSLIVQECGSAVLAELSTLCRTGKLSRPHVAALVTDGIAVLASAMLRHVDSEELQDSGNNAIVNIVGCERAVRARRRRVKLFA